MNVEIINLAYNPVKYMEELKNLIIQYDSYHLVQCNQFDGFSHRYLYERDPISLARYLDLIPPGSIPNGVNNAYCYGALVDGRLVGYVQFNLVIKLPILGSNNLSRNEVEEIMYRTNEEQYLNINNSFNVCYILGVMVTNEYRNMNIADMLYQYMEKTCIDNNVFRITSNIAEGNSSSVIFHMKHGYRVSNLLNGNSLNQHVYNISKDLR